MNIVLAEDDKILRLGLKSKIERNTPYKVIASVSNGKEALDAIVSSKAELLITDIKMPLMDGLELVKKIGEQCIKIKIIVLSGYDDYKFVRETLKAGAVDYLLKPVDENLLYDLLKNIDDSIERGKKNEKQLEQFQDLLTDSLDMFKERFVINLTEGVIGDISVFDKRLEEFGIVKQEAFLLAVAGQDDIFTIRSEKQLGSYSYNTNYFKGKILKIFSGLDLNINMLLAEQNNSAVILFSSNNTLTFADEVDKCLSELSNGLMKEFGFSFSFGVSEVFYDPGRGSACYFQSLLAFNRRFYNGKGNINKFEPEKCTYDYFDNKNLLEQVNLLVDYLDSGLTNKVGNTIEEILSLLLKKNINPNQFKEISLWIINKIAVISDDFYSAVQSYSENETDPKDFINEVDTFVELKEYLINTFTVLSKIIIESKSERSQRIIDISKEYIFSHFNENVTLKSVADHVHLNQNYFSELFRREVGKNFIDFITEVRINKAKKLLMKDDLKIYEVGLKVGYIETVTFNRAFKRVEGMSPAEYRRILRDK